MMVMRCGWQVAIDQRRASFHSAVSYSLIVLPLLIFLVLLSNKLDYNQQPQHFPFSQGTLVALHTTPAPDAAAPFEMSYFVVCMPLYFTFLILICLSFGSRGGNLCN